MRLTQRSKTSGVRRPQGLRRTARVLTWLLPVVPRITVMLRIVPSKIKNKHMLRTGDALVVVANHRSFWDIPYMWVPQKTPTIFVAQHKIQEWFLVGWIAKKLGNIFVNRKDEASRASVNPLAEEFLCAGGRVMWYIEGKMHQLPYDAEQNMGHTYTGAAKAIIRARAKGLTCALRGTSEVGGLITAMFRRPAVRTIYGDHYFAGDDYLRAVGANPEDYTEEQLDQAARMMTDDMAAEISANVAVPVK